MPPIPPPPVFRAECLRCRRPAAVCLCAHITELRTRTQFVFLTHPKESRKIKNRSGRIAHLSLAASEVLVGVDFSEHPRVNELLNDASLSCRLLYPRADGAMMEGPNPSSVRDLPASTPVLFLLDATWSSAKKIMRLSTNLHDLPRLSLTVARPSEFLIKRQPHPSCLATIEAVDRTLWDLARVGDEQFASADSDRLLAPFHAMNRLAKEAAADPSRSSYRGNGSCKVPADRVRRQSPSGSGRNLLFRGESPEGCA